MTEGAQQALRRIMENYSETTRFALACNQSDKIIEPVQSRCAILRFHKLTDAQLAHRLEEVCKAEKVSSISRSVRYLSSFFFQQPLPLRGASIHFSNFFAVFFLLL
ncbi:hypothetical protein TELCIR_17253 [Teladorsagia circumcincta]|uniref:Replication factor C C-terminal domain-containing protein n=1 Tax=Teladorsagia circumcincta TaxID=45464 RepID=A0A2G9TT95_TELCI|nr:hypothetical protein TELCIR_17253 [Teladorsagia circumcincta]